MPLTERTRMGQYWSFVNLSSGTLTIQSSGGNTITTVGAGRSLDLCNLYLNVRNNGGVVAV